MKQELNTAKSCWRKCRRTAKPDDTTLIYSSSEAQTRRYCAKAIFHEAYFLKHLCCTCAKCRLSEAGPVSQNPVKQSLVNEYEQFGNGSWCGSWRVWSVASNRDVRWRPSGNVLCRGLVCLGQCWPDYLLCHGTLAIDASYYWMTKRRRCRLSILLSLILTFSTLWVLVLRCIHIARTLRVLLRSIRQSFTTTLTLSVILWRFAATLTLLLLRRVNWRCVVVGLTLRIVDGRLWIDLLRRGRLLVIWLNVCLIRSRGPLVSTACRALARTLTGRLLHLGFGSFQIRIHATELFPRFLHLQCVHKSHGECSTWQTTFATSTIVHIDRDWIVVGQSDDRCFGRLEIIANFVEYTLALE